MSHYIEFKDGIPRCWEWAWNNMHKVSGKGYKAGDMIIYHTENKIRCPFCIKVKTSKDRIKWI